MSGALQSRTSVEEDVIIASYNLETAPRFLLARKQGDILLTNESPLETISRYSGHDFTSIADYVSENEGDDEVLAENCMEEWVYLTNRDDFLMNFFDHLLLFNYNNKESYDSSDVKRFSHYKSHFGLKTTIIEDQSLGILKYFKEEEENVLQAEEIRSRLENLDSVLESDVESKVYYEKMSTVRQISRDGVKLTPIDINIMYGELNISQEYPYVVMISDDISYKIPQGSIPPTVDNSSGKEIIMYGDDIRINFEQSIISYTDPKKHVTFLSYLQEIGYTVSKESQNSYSADVFLQNYEVNQIVFQHFIFNDNLINYYLNTKDSGCRTGILAKIKMIYNLVRVSPIGVQKRDKISVKYTISNTIQVIDDNSIAVCVISAKNLPSKADAEEFSYNIRALLFYYDEISEDIMSFYVKYFASTIKEQVEEVDNLQNLRRTKPKYFDSTYSTLCVGSSLQPKLIKKGDYAALDEDVRDKSAIIFGDIEKREGDNPITVYLSCHSNGDNKVIYLKNGFYPCCARSATGISHVKPVLNKTARLEPGAAGQLDGLSDIFGTKKVFRRGIASSPNPFISALREIGIKFEIDEATEHVSQYKQCMYDYSEEEIKYYMLNSEKYDSDLVADGIGISFATNIVIIEVKGKKPQIRIPRYKFCYFKTFYSNFDTSFIYRYENNGKVFYEPIHIEKLPSRTEMSRITRLTMERMQKSYIFSYLDTNTGFVEKMDLFSLKEYPDVVSGLQIIDSYGKLSGVLEFDKKDDSITRIVIYKSKSDAVAGHYIDGSDVETKNFEKVRTDDEKLIKKLIPGYVPVIKTALIREDGDLVWLNRISLYENNEATVPIYSSDVISPESRSAFKRTRSLMLQYISWLYCLYPGDVDEKYNHFSDIIEISDDVEYYFDQEQGPLPNVDYYGAISYLENRESGLIVDEKIILPSEIIKEGVMAFISYCSRSPNLDPPTRIYDEVAQPSKDVLLVGERERIGYEKALNRKFGELSFSFDKENYKLKSPFIFSTPDGKSYILQNVSEIDSQSRAVNCSMIWRARKINTGYETSPMNPDVGNDAFRYVSICTINPDMTVTIPTKEEGILIVKHGNPQRLIYSALLPLF